MKKTIVIILGSAVLLAVVIAGVAGGKISRVSKIVQYSNSSGHNYADCRKAMLNAEKEVLDESRLLQPKWCRNWWSKLPESEKIQLGDEAENAVPSE